MSLKQEIAINNYPELNQFKNHIEIDSNGVFHQPYSAIKSTTQLYRFIFWGFGVLYLFLAMILYTKSFTWACSFLFGSAELVKTLFLSFCALSSGSSILVGFCLRPEREAVKRVFREIRANLLKTYNKNVINLGILRFFPFGDHYLQYQSYKHLYYDAEEKIRKKEEEALFLVDRIARFKKMEEIMREKLYNQAVLEFRDHLEAFLRTYQETFSKRSLESIS